MAQSMGGCEWALLVALSILWGGSFFFFEITLRDFGPLTIVFDRVGLAALWLYGFLRLSRASMPGDLATWRQFAAMGLLNNVIPFSLIVWGQQFIDSGVAAILNASTPLFTVVLSHFLIQGERLTVGRVVAVLLGFAGVAVLIDPRAVLDVENHGLGELAVVGAAISYAFAGIYGRRFKRVAPMVTATGQVTCSAAMTLPLALLFEQPWQVHPSLQAAGALLGLSLLCTAIAYVIFFRILAAAGAVNLLLVTLLVPPSALVLGVVVLGERPSVNVFIGLALIFAGLITIDGRLVRRVATFLAGSSAPRG